MTCNHRTVRPSLSWLAALALLGAAPTARADETDAWWDRAWPYRVPVEASGSGVVSARIDFGAALEELGLNHALLDLRSVRVVAYRAGEPLEALPHTETYSTLLEDAESPQVGGSPSGAYWSVNDGSAEADASRASRGNGSLKAVVENRPGGYGYPGVELHIADGSALSDWSRYETLVYDVWPEVNRSALDQAPDLYSFKLYNACSGSPVTQGGPPLSLGGWNPVSVSLNPLDSCWPSDGLDLSNITRMEFHTRDNDTVNGNSGLWDDGDELTLWFDDLRLVDQDTGALRFASRSGADGYYVYFDVLRHEGHPAPSLATGLGPAVVTGLPGAVEAGGYLHRVAGVTGAGGLSIWTAPSVEKVLRTMTVPANVATARIAAARGEFEPLQLVVRSPSARTLPVSAGRLVKGGETIPPPALHRVDYVNVTTAGDHFDRFGEWPDPLWPLESGESVLFPAGRNQPIWLTVKVPRTAAPGIYRGTVSIGNVVVPYELEVWDFELPREIHLQSEWGFSWSSIVDLYRGTIGGSVQECYWEVVEAFKQDFMDHRLIPKGVAWPAGLNYPGGVEYDCDGTLEPDAWGAWDFATIGGRYAHGDGGFNGGTGFPSFLSHGPQSNWPPDSLPYSFCGVSRSGVLGSAAFRNQWTRFLSAVNRYIVTDDYADQAYYHIVNEPQTHEDYAITGQISALVESAAPNLRQMVSEQVEPVIYNHPGAKIDIWMPTITTYEPEKCHDRQKNHGESCWWYYLYGDDPPLPNPILMSHPGMEARVTPWLAWAERVDGLLHYSATDWSTNPWQQPNVTGRDNGDAFFFYPPQKSGGPLGSCGENGHRLVPSIRWENLRDGMEDYEYLWLAAGGKPEVDILNAADPHVANLVRSRTRFSRVPTDLETARAGLVQDLLALPVPALGAFPLLLLLGLQVVLLGGRGKDE